MITRIGRITRIASEGAVSLSPECSALQSAICKVSDGTKWLAHRKLESVQ